MACLNPFILVNDQYPNGLACPCRNCKGCRVARSSEWALRLSHELTEFQQASFVTLTYANENVPPNYSLRKEDFQKWMKRLRKQLGSKVKTKYYGVGEYGSSYGRPHYHAILLGVGIIDTPLIEKTWGLGMVDVGTVTYDSISYVVDYLDKKLTGKLAEEAYAKTGRIAPFSLQSQGMGLRYAEKNKQQIIDNLSFTYRGKPRPVPKYYRDKLGLPPEPFTEKAVEGQMNTFKRHMHLNNLDSMPIPDFIKWAKDPYYRIALEDDGRYQTIMDSIANSRRIQNEMLKAKTFQRQKKNFL